LALSAQSIIASRQNPRFKALRKLADDPARHELAIADGIHLVAACIERGVAMQQLLVSESGMRNSEIGGLLAQCRSVECLNFSDALFREITGIAAPTGIAAVFAPPRPEVSVLRGDAVLLEGVQDAGNVGTILRSAAAAGVVDVLLGPGCAGAWTMKVLRAAQGAHFSLRIRDQADLLAAVQSSPVRSVATVAREGQDLFQLNLSGPVLWLLGSEGAGLSPSLRAAAGTAATIPLAGATESLNVAATAAVCLFEARRQRRQTKRPAPGGPSR
jgi:TrmH family RNA methyltransferase